MGLDFSKGEAHFSYHGFMVFRQKLAEEIGIRDLKLWWETPGHASIMERDPIVHLLDHSDCDGELSAEQCEGIAPRLRQLVSNWPDYSFDKAEGLKLAEAMEEAVRDREPLEFR